MKIWLDDIRKEPEGWIRCYWPDEVIAFLEKGGVEELSLDHDLGNDARGTGYDVVKWIEEKVFTSDFVPPQKIRVHSQNVEGKKRMHGGIRAIKEELWRKMNEKNEGRVAPLG